MAASTSIGSRILISCRLSAVERLSSMKMILSVTPSLTMYGTRHRHIEAVCANTCTSHTLGKTLGYTFSSPYYLTHTHGHTCIQRAAMTQDNSHLWERPLGMTWPHIICTTSQSEKHLHRRPYNTKDITARQRSLQHQCYQWNRIPT